MADDAADTWEALDDHTELDKRLQKLVSKVEQKINDSAISKPSSSIPSSNEPFTSNKPAIRILRRDTTQSQSTPSLKSMVLNKPIRTMEEREAAYAEARLRIMGSADDSYPNLEEGNSSKNSCSNTKSLSSSSSSTSVNSKKPNSVDGHPDIW